MFGDCDVSKMDHGLRLTKKETDFQNCSASSGSGLSPEYTGHFAQGHTRGHSHCITRRRNQKHVGAEPICHAICIFPEFYMKARHLKCDISLDLLLRMQAWYDASQMRARANEIEVQRDAST